MVIEGTDNILILHPVTSIASPEEVLVTELRENIGSKSQMLALMNTYYVDTLDSKSVKLIEVLLELSKSLKVVASKKSMSLLRYVNDVAIVKMKTRPSLSYSVVVKQ